MSSREPVDCPEKRRIQNSDDSETVESKKSRQEEEPAQLGVHPENLAFHIVYLLQTHGISKELFANHILRRARSSFDVLLKDVKPYDQMRIEVREDFRKILEWVDLDYWDQIAVLNGYKVENFEPLAFTHGKHFKFEPGESAESIRALELKDQAHRIILPHLAKRIKFELGTRKIPHEMFIRNVIGRSINVKVYEKMLEWLDLSPEDQIAVLDGRKVRHFEPTQEEISPAQETLLEHAYRVQNRPDPDEIPWLAGKLRLKSFQVGTWFYKRYLEDQRLEWIDTKQVSKAVLQVLHELHSTTVNFYEKALGLSSRAAVLRNPPPFENMRAGKKVYEKMVEFLGLSKREQEAVLRGEKIRKFEPMKSDQDRILALPLTDDFAKILPDNLIQRIQFELKTRKIRHVDFARDVLGLSLNSFASLLQRRTKNELEWRQKALVKCLDWVRRQQSSVDVKSDEDPNCHPLVEDQRLESIEYFLQTFDPNDDLDD